MGQKRSPDATEGNQCHSLPVLVSDLTRLLGNRGVTVYQDPFSLRAEEIARLAILRADVHGMKNYGPAPPPLEERRDMYQEAIEELLDAIYYLTRQVARMEDQRERIQDALVEKLPCVAKGKPGP